VLSRMVSAHGQARPPEDDTPTETFPAIRLPIRSRAQPPTRTRERRTIKLSAALGGVILIVLGIASYEVVSGVGHKNGASVPAAVSTTVASGPATAGASAGASSPAAASPTASPSAAPSPSSTPTTVSVQVLKPVSAAAFGPDGTADGDDPTTAGRVLDGGSYAGWQSEWYATPLFGDLQSGTGLLLNMGRALTITTVRVSLGGAAGGDVQLRAGNAAALSSLPVVATESGAGGTIELRLARSVQARYVLIWFTRLPPDGAGTYQARVYSVAVDGQP
jgi:hypothetical protein